MNQKAESMIYNRVMQEIAEPVKNEPGVQVPKKDKIIEWTLFHIYLELKGINQAVHGIEFRNRVNQQSTGI
jgi:hypothetical protein